MQFLFPLFLIILKITSCTWIQATVETGDYRPSNYLDLVEHGYEGPEFSRKLEYGIIFHENTLNYPPYVNRSVCVKWLDNDPYAPCIKHKFEREFLGANQNKLFGFTRGFVPVMDKSCMFSWRANPTKERPGTSISVWAYGWKNKESRPWETPGQNPYMGSLKTNVKYTFSVEKVASLCKYTITDGSTFTWTNTTASESGGLDDGVKFALYFGGDAPATAPVTVSYSKNC